MTYYISHVGVKERSGRYPFGSGERPYQRLTKLQKKGAVKKSKLAKDVLGRDVSVKDMISRNESDPDKDLRMKKGERVQHITGVDFGDIRDGQLYVTAEEYDNHLYEAFLSSNLLSKGWNPSKVSIELKQDLIAPSSNQQREVFNQFREANGKMLQNDLNVWNQKKGRESIDINNMDDDKVYDIFMNSLEMQSSSQKNFYGMLKRNGFNAVLDEHDVTGSWMQGKKPLIIMDALNTLGDVKIEELTVPKMQEAFEKWFKMNKTN